jgi:hypothetical protein
MPFPSPTFQSEFGKSADLQVSKKEFASLFAQFQKFLSVSHDSNGDILSINNILNVQDWTPIPYDANMWSATGGTWTVPSSSILQCSIRRLGSSVSIHLTISTGSTITVGTPSNLLVTLPNGLKAAEYTASVGGYRDDSGAFYSPILVTVNQASEFIAIYLFTLANFPLTTSQVLYAQIEFQIQD